MLPVVWNVAEPLEVEYRWPIHQSSDQNNGGRKEIEKPPCSFPSFICPYGSIACSPADKANLFGSYFSANSSLRDPNVPDPPTQPLSNLIPSIILSACKVCWVPSSLKTDKTSGPDDIPPGFLKEAADELEPVLCCLFHPILISCMSQYL